MRAAGKVVGIDLFDDYFTQWGDSRLHRFRRWLSLASQACDFALCSTRVMRRIVERYSPNLPVHVLPDPYPEIDCNRLTAIVSNKLARAQRERIIDIVWFGIGSNPTFTVGLQDLAAYSSSLRALASSGFKPRLAILTNKSALKPEMLAQLSRIPIDYRIDFWSLEAEIKALANAFACFLPVNGQGFSRAKSLNRALTAISSGAQVLSPGFPLYAELHPAIYTDAEELALDAANGRCRIRKENVSEIASLVQRASSVVALAKDLYAFLSGLVARMENGQPSDSPAKIALIYGASQDLPAVRGARAAGVLSVASPFARVERAYDIRVDYHSGGCFDFWITPQIRRHLAPRRSRARLQSPFSNLPFLSLRDQRPSQRL